MKGIILAGGSGTRLYPMTAAVSKQMLPVYDKPMIYYPLSTLMQFKIRDILIISTPVDTPVIGRLLGDGSRWGINLSYKVQPSPDGLAQAFTIGEDFIDGKNVGMILGDNLLWANGFHADSEYGLDGNATIFTYKVLDPKRFGVVEFDKDEKIISIEEKPAAPKSNYAAIGLYFYPGDVSERAKALKPSKRGELEITDLNNTYLAEGRLAGKKLGDGAFWIDAGTPNSLADATTLVRMIYRVQGLNIGCLEETAMKNGWRTPDEIARDLAENKSNYAQYARRIATELSQCTL